jgi:hypothetical protein
LQVMAGLEFDICEIKTSYIHNDEILDLDEWKKTISTFPRYSCLFWADHLQAMAFSLKLLHKVKVFMCTNFPYWLEVLSLVKEVHMAIRIIKVVVDWCNVSFLCHVFIGSAVAVERVFSGCWDTISLYRARYHLDSDASKETVTSGLCKGQYSPTWLNTWCTVLYFVHCLLYITVQ